MSIKHTLALAALCLAPAAALAESAPVKQACATEMQKFCASVEKGKGLRRKCLESHTADLSDGCKTSLAEHAAKKTDKGGQ